MSLVSALETIVASSVAVTARALAAVDPDLTLLQWRALVVVRDRRERPLVADIAVALGATPSATSRLLKRLQARGLIASHRDDRDRRVRRLALTDQGQALVRRVVLARDEELLRLPLAGEEEAITRLAAAFRVLVDGPASVG